MREIKFRAWDKANRCMIGDDDSEADFKFYGGGVTVRYCSEEFYEGGGEIHSRDRWEDCDVEIMQYTGLKDKNGKEIYEGDIVRGVLFYPESIFDGDKVTLVEETNKVVFDKGCWCIDGKDDYDGGVLCRYDELYVLGNEFENPELLPKEPDDETSVARDDASSTDDNKQRKRINL